MNKRKVIEILNTLRAVPKKNKTKMQCFHFLDRIGFVEQSTFVSVPEIVGYIGLSRSGLYTLFRRWQRYRFVTSGPVVYEGREVTGWRLTTRACSYLDKSRKWYPFHDPIRNAMIEIAAFRDDDIKRRRFMWDTGTCYGIIRFPYHEDDFIKIAYSRYDDQAFGRPFYCSNLNQAFRLASRNSPLPSLAFRQMVERETRQTPTVGGYSPMFAWLEGFEYIVLVYPFEPGGYLTAMRDAINTLPNIKIFSSMESAFAAADRCDPKPSRAYRLEIIEAVGVSKDKPDLDYTYNQQPEGFDYDLTKQEKLDYRDRG